MKHKALLISLLFAALIGMSFIAGMFMYLFTGSSVPSGLFKSAVGVVTVEGPIITSKEVVEDLDNFRKDDGVDAVVLRIESPGGSVAASQEIFEAVEALKAVKPVIASMGSVAASGGYYIACAASEIFANPGTATGSIGVKLEHVNVGELMKWTKMERDVLKSGALKDMLRSDRPISPEARIVLQGVIDDIFRQFKTTVAKSRGIDPAEVDRISDGRIYTGEQALSLSLVDELGGFSMAVKRAAKRGEIKVEPKVVYPKDDRNIFERLFFDARSAASAQMMSMDYLQPMIMYSGN